MVKKTSEEIEEKEAELHTEKLKFLYEFQCEQYDIVKAQTVRLDDKAAKYLTFVAIVMATLGIISRYYFFEISKYNFFSIASVVFLALAFAVILNISRLLFSSLKVTEVFKLATGQEMNNYISKSKLDEVYEGLSNDLSEINNSYTSSLANKKEILENAYKETAFLGIVLVLLLVSIMIDLYTRDVKPIKSTTTTCIVDLSNHNDEHNTKTTTTTCSTTAH
ncbi:hypothetical protein F994_02784 [Acinetobacter bohemicus ANC 3994]|uniref:Uncharacterized protein n=1 Tax=Acinetobacter bohemicus ANC 3994 TaxID=1217715 RepID=N8Q9R9_9GAMM|nr:hypothetical protein [Acinetobacter bohemicus]ENU18657.1 hypothetical protein F994_02784 [Acinetobacter bohemicus ANC 3994]